MTQVAHTQVVMASSSGARVGEGRGPHGGKGELGKSELGKSRDVLTQQHHTESTPTAHPCREVAAMLAKHAVWGSAAGARGPGAFNLRDLIKARDMLHVLLRDQMHHHQAAGEALDMEALRRQCVCRVLSSVYASCFRSASDQAAVRAVIERLVGGGGPGSSSGPPSTSIDSSVPSVLRVGDIFIPKGAWAGPWRWSSGGRERGRWRHNVCVCVCFLGGGGGGRGEDMVSS